MAKQTKDPFVGTRIREYEILDVIGKGGMGAVYRARHVYLEEERAIKVVQSEFAKDEAFVNRFIREAKIMTKLRHPNLVQLYEFGTLEGNIFFMVLELVRGESLQDRVLRMSRIPQDDTLQIIKQAALGLHAAHQKGIVHRDISPDNLLLVHDESGDETTKVIDFGIAKPLAEKTRIFTRTNMFVGKPEFCSPEQCGALEEGEIIDCRSDIYSLGVTFYYALAGKLPFYSPTAQGYLHKHIYEEAKPITAHFAPGTIPEPVVRIINKMLAKKRDQRYTTMEELAREIDAYVFQRTGPNPVAGAADPDKKTVPAADMPQGHLFERRYLIEKKIREGASTTIYKAMDQMLEVPVALKIFGQELTKDPRTLNRLKKGVILARNINHPNVCRIYDVGEFEGGLYLAMEFVEGKTLADVMPSHEPMDQKQAMQILKQMLAALEQMHRAGVIHRNLKPQNVMMGPDNHPFIMDFATPSTGLSGHWTGRRDSLGTPSYMAPEQFGEQRVDARADIFSMGVLMFKLLTGRLPFEASSVAALLFARMNAEPKTPSAYLPGINPELEKIIMRAIAKKPEDRFQTADEFRQVLENFDNAPPPPSTEKRKLEADQKEKSQGIFEKGRELYEQSRLEEALSAWREALEINPKDAIIQRCIAAAESRLTSENQIRKEVMTQLGECEDLLHHQEFPRTLEVLDNCQKQLQRTARLRDLQERILAFRKNVETEQKKVATSKRDTAKMAHSYNPEDLKTALKNLMGTDAGRRAGSGFIEEASDPASAGDASGIQSKKSN